VHKHIFAIRAAQKAETLGVVKPFHCSLFHNYSFVALCIAELNVELIAR
jgi:hypothetical protein